MRKITSTCFCIIVFSICCQAQFYKSILPSPAFTDSLKKIVTDFSYNFYNIQGNVLSTQEDVDTYESKNSIPGAIKTMIFRFHSEEDTTAGFQAVMYSGDDFKEAAKIYKNVFRYVNKSHFAVKENNFSFSGSMEEPTESIRFTSSILKAITNNNDYKRFFAEVEMVNSFTGWEVHLNLHSKKDDKEKY